MTLTTIVPVLNDKNEITEFIATRKDITELVNSKESIKRTLISDRLTNLKNRYKLFEDMKDNTDTSLLCLLNIDGFKGINDFYGHKIADQLLISVANTIEKFFRGTQLNLYKLHADEFALLCTDCIKKDFIEHVNEIIEIISKKEFLIKENQIHITISGGISFEKDNLFISADIALQKAKEMDEKLFIYNEGLNTTKDISKNITGIKMLKEAIKMDSILPFYQPIYNLKTSKIEKYEALARIEINDEVYSPLHFLNIAKKSKLYPNITEAIFTKSLEFFKDKDFEFSINISIIDVLNKKTTDFIKDKLSQFNRCEKIVFEILESEEIVNFQVMKNFIKDIKTFGCKVAIDDFGSGYSNFAHILELDVDYLKIDASLVKNITKNKNSEILVQGIIDFSKSLNIKTVAEYVETKECMELLLKLGVDYAQGYYIGKPLKDIV